MYFIGPPSSNVAATTTNGTDLDGHRYHIDQGEDRQSWLIDWQRDRTASRRFKD
jgi:hypothetical protein